MSAPMCVNANIKWRWQDVRMPLALAFGGAGLTALLANEVGGGGRPLMHRARTAVIAFQTNSSEVNLGHSHAPRQRFSSTQPAYH